MVWYSRLFCCNILQHYDICFDNIIGAYDIWVAIVFSSPFHWFCYMKGKHLLPFVDIKDTRKWHSCEAWLSMFLIKVNINNCNANTYRSVCFLQSFLVPRLLVTCVYGHVLFVFAFITICKNGNKELIIKHTITNIGFWYIILHVYRK